MRGTFGVNAFVSLVHRYPCGTASADSIFVQSLGGDWQVRLAPVGNCTIVHSCSEGLAARNFFNPLYQFQTLSSDPVNTATTVSRHSVSTSGLSVGCDSVLGAF